MFLSLTTSKSMEKQLAYATIPPMFARLPLTLVQAQT
jgi:hypothetical protein